MKHVFWVEPCALAGRPGPNTAAWNPCELYAGGIRAILTVNRGVGVEPEALRAAGIAHHQIVLPISEPPVPGALEIGLRLVPEAYAWIEQQIGLGRAVLVHCTHGHDRSGLVLAYWIARRHACSASAAIEKLRALRPKALTALGWKDLALDLLERLCAASETASSNPRRSSVRRAAPTDAGALAGLLRCLASEDLGDIRIEISDREISATEAELLVRIVGSMGGEVLVLAELTEVVGLIVLTPSDEPLRMGFAMAIRADRRGRGAGRALLNGAIDWARGAGIASLDLRVRSDNTAAVRLYESLGFDDRPSPTAGICADSRRMTLPIRSAP